MRKARYALGLALLVAASLYLLPALRAADEPVPDSPEVSDLLTQAKGHAARVAENTALIKSYGVGSEYAMSWEGHCDQLNTIGEHINNLGKVLRQMSERREFASSWQQNAIDRIVPLAAELASKVNATIVLFNEDHDYLFSPRYQDYLTDNHEVSTSLSALISDFATYGKSKAKHDVLGEELETRGI